VFFHNIGFRLFGINPKVESALSRSATVRQVFCTTNKKAEDQISGFCRMEVVKLSCQINLISERSIWQ
jgi:hypothetical protein